MEELRIIVKRAYNPSEPNPLYRRGYGDGAMDLYNLIKKELERGQSDLGDT